MNQTPEPRENVLSPAQLVCGLVLYHDCVNYLEWRKMFGSSGQLQTKVHQERRETSFS